MGSNKRLSQGVDPDALDRLVRDLGVRVKLFKSTICPNVKSLETLDHNVNCSVCNNHMIDFKPKETIAMFQQQNITEEYKVRGTFHIDEILVTFLSGETLSTFTRVELLDFEEDFYELVQKQIGSAVDRLKYPACTVLGVFVIRNNVRKEFHNGVDFDLDVNGDIKWISANKPNDKEVYTVYYKYRPVFRAIKAVHRDRYSQFNRRPEKITSPHTLVDDRAYVKLPETWVLKRDYLLERRDLDNSLLTKNEFFDPNV